MSEHAVQKEESMVKQKTMIADHFEKLSRAREENQKVVYTFVPGNLTELILAFDLLPVHPEINALQSGMRKVSGDYIREAERFGHSEDVCTYVKCDVGMLMKGNIGPTGKPLPEPDLLLLSYTGCFTFMKWFEILKSHYDCPVVMIQVPYQGDGRIEEDMTNYVADQIRDELVPALEKLSGKKLDEDRLSELLERSCLAEEDLVWSLESARHKPSPIDAYFGGVYYIGPIFTAFRGTEDCVEYYRLLRGEIEGRIAAGLGPVTPEGVLQEEKYRVVVEGPPNWTSFREFWKMFYDEGAVVVASTYTKVGGTYDRGFRHDPLRPMESLADYCLGCYTNLNLPDRAKMLADYVNDYEADGFLINSIKSCNSFSAGQLLILREVENLSGKPGAFIESDLVDPRYFSGANIKNRLESYFQMIDLKRQEKVS
ncbi:MAG: benzoyl-CoA reductase subunit B [Candidatus Krumholzibacteria bacterium]|jgi:benzoyl-CoA reductase subunit B|nr:benzoyl-CoA reductase subunit B [Candidatus Krumholzibacteria bacterium]MDP6668442.1 benzoyl-CoA reductase subunit B [Candidatus Krumholzibacteria bacterium]MDP6797263.1 benzoyl-CoA reductase subunit B [Candidatus Krumholzibacteria bacterium]MDP7021834.1 benzoyl-CoA reductase subunit B [Candidatus Krumholzibacteria bacterium]